MVLSLPDESSAKLIMSRSVMVRSCYELWGRADSLAELHRQLRISPTDRMLPYFKPEKSFRFTVETFNKIISMSEKIEKIEVSVLMCTCVFLLSLTNLLVFQLLAYRRPSEVEEC